MSTTTTTLHAWLLLQLDADEAAARAASPGPWSKVREGLQGGAVIRAGDTRVTRVYESNWPTFAPTDANAAHIARHDPARVLAQVAALRAVVELHTTTNPYLPGSRLHDLDDPTCNMCADWEHANSFDGPPNVEWPCPTLRALATIFADREGYDECWRP